MLVGVGLSIVSLGLVIEAWRTAGSHNEFLYDLLLNLGAGLVMTLATYALLNPLFREIRTGTVVERPWLDRDALIASISKVRSSVAVLETWTDMLEPPYRDRFSTALRSAVSNGAIVRVLLLDPNSPGARLRAQELRYRRDVQLAILSNVRALYEIRGQLAGDLARSIQVKLYSVSPSIQMYRWDQIASVSFFPLEQSNFSAPQIEAYTSTPLGQFVEARFDELWDAHSTRDLDSFLMMRLRIQHDGQDLEGCDVRFVDDDELCYVTGPNLIRLASRHGVRNLVAILEPIDGPTIAYDLEQYESPDSRSVDRVIVLLRTKYGVDLGGAGETPLVLVLRPRVNVLQGDAIAAAE